MKNLSSLLEKLTQALNRGAYEKDLVARVIKDKIGVEMSPQDIFIRDKILEITSTPGVKNEIRLREEEILGELKNSHRLFLSRIVFK